MQQVPRYLLIGNGRLSTHLQHYFSLLSIHSIRWQRKAGVDLLLRQLKTVTHVLILLPDDVIEPFAADYLLPYCEEKRGPLLIHCSGCLVSEKVIGAHPLMTFRQVMHDADFYTRAEYEQIPFVIDEGISFDTLFPTLVNPHVTIAKKYRPKYHAMCVMGGNFTCLLWQKIFQVFEQEFGMAKEVVYPYLQRQIANIMSHPEVALTGPLVRHDMKTIDSHLQALQHDAFKRIYEAFVAVYHHTGGIYPLSTCEETS